MLGVCSFFVLQYQYMSEVFEQLRQKALAAKEEQAKQAQLGSQKAREESKAEILTELEQGYERLGELALREAEADAKISQLFHEIRTAEREAKKILEETIPAAEQDEAFVGQEELRAEAIRVLQEEVKTLKDSIPNKEAELEEARRQHGEVKTEMRGLLGKAKGYLGEREIPERRMNEIRNWIEQERKTRNLLNSYRNHATREAPDFAYWASDEKGDYEQWPVTKTPDGNQVTYTFEEGHTYSCGIPREIFTNSRFYNEYIDGFKDGLNKFLQEEGGWKDKKLSPEQIDKIKRTAYRLAYRDEEHPERDKEVIVYDGVNPVPHTEVLEDNFFTTLTPGEQKIIEESITNYENRENLEKRLRLSEYREDVHKAVLERAGAENQEYNRRSLAEKLPELQVELDKALNELREYEAKLASSKEAENLFRQAYQILESLRVKTGHLESSKLNTKYAEEKTRELQARREALPRRLLSKKPKDETEDNRLAREIEQYQESKTSAERSVDSYKKEIGQTEQHFTEVATKLEAFREGMNDLLNKIRSLESSRDRENEFYRELNKLQREIMDAEKSERELKAKLQKLEWTKEQWEGGKYLASSLAEILAKQK